MSGQKQFDQTPSRPHTAGTTGRSTLQEQPLGHAVVTPGGDQQIKANVFTISVIRTVEYIIMFPVHRPSLQNYIQKL